MSEEHKLQNMDGANLTINLELQEYLCTRPPINPITATLKDPVVPANLVTLGLASLMIPSAITDKGVDGINGFRLAQGISAITSIVWKSYLQVKGRYHVYQDLADFQQENATPQQIIARADHKDQNAYQRFESWWMTHNVNINATIALGNCALMACAGYISNRPGEMITAGLWAPSYLLAMLPERSVLKNEFNDKAHKLVSKIPPPLMKVFSDVKGSKFGAVIGKIAQQPPLVLSAIYGTVATRAPAFISAVLADDGYQASFMAGAVLQDWMNAEVDKRAMGRGEGSILTNPDGHVIAKNMLEGRNRSLFFT